MDVSVFSKFAHRSLRSAARASVLGDGLLERARSTSLALLGFTAAIGLAMVALVFNQGWPLIPGAPIPGLGDGHEAVGDASVAAPAADRGGRAAVASPSVGRANPALARGGSKRTGHSAALGASRPRQASGLVVSQPTSTSPTGGEALPAPSQAAAQPASAPGPEVVPASNPGSPSPEPVAQGAPESPAPAKGPPTDNGEGGGHGHHLGRGGGHGHGHPGGEGDSPESSESPEPTPTPAETPPPEANAPEESDAGQSHAPPGGHGGGHGYGHGHW